MKRLLLVPLLFMTIHSFSQSVLFKGTYLSVNLPYQNTKGDMDGQSFLYTSQEVFLIPFVEGGSGFGFGIGSRGEMGAFEFNYNRTEHIVDFAGSPGDAIMRIYSMDYKYFFNPDRKFQPFIHFSWMPAFSLKVKEASADISNNPEIRDARFIANIGTTQLGGGISYVIFSRIALNASVTYRFTKYTGVAGGKDIVSARISEPLKGSGVNAFLTLNIVLFGANKSSD